MDHDSNSSGHTKNKDLTPLRPPLLSSLERWIKQRSLARRNKGPALRSSTAIERNGEELVVRLVTDKQEGIQLVRLEKQKPVLSARSLERLGLSRRETEVLRWLAQEITKQAMPDTFFTFFDTFFWAASDKLANKRPLCLCREGLPMSINIFGRRITLSAYQWRYPPYRDGMPRLSHSLQVPLGNNW